MKHVVLEVSKLVTLIAAVCTGLLSLGPGWSVFIDEGARAKYFLERQRDHLEKACRAAPDSIALHAQLAETYEELGVYQDVFRCRQKLIELDPESPLHYRDFANDLSILRTEGAAYFQCNLEDVPARVVNLFKAAVELAPQDEALTREYAMSFYLIGGDFKAEAVAAWKHSLDIATDEQTGKEAHLHMARWLTRSGKLSRARWHLIRADGFQNAQLIAVTENSLAQAEREAGITELDSRQFAAHRKFNKRHRRWPM
jgi:tetratricopeptide (TPR) repeat protein